MSENNSNSNKTHAESIPLQKSEKSAAQVDQQKDQSKNDFVNIERRVQRHTVFQIDDSSFISSMPPTTHWSIAWSDLMMTMFVLFLSMFVYQAAHEDFLQEKEPEIIGENTTDALQMVDVHQTPFPFAPISSSLPLVPDNTSKIDEQIQSQPPPSTLSAEKKIDQKTGSPTTIVLNSPHDEPAISSQSPTTPIQPEKDTVEPLPILPTSSVNNRQNQFQEIFTIGQKILKKNDLGNFAAIDIVPDKTMRIILTGDLLFALGESTLSDNAKASLKKIAAVIQSIPYMINVVGHTDNIPMKSYKFKSNWELSVTRASAVARFLIKEQKMNPTQFVVSGYSSYRPVRPNTNADNRARNRRVEIIISKRLPAPHPSTVNNLQTQINEK